MFRFASIAHEKLETSIIAQTVILFSVVILSLFAMYFFLYATIIVLILTFAAILFAYAYKANRPSE